MSVHIETIAAEYTIMAAAEVGDDVYHGAAEPLQKPALVISDMDNVMVVVGEKGQLMQLLTDAMTAIDKLPD